MSAFILQAPLCELIAAGGSFLGCHAYALLQCSVIVHLHGVIDLPSLGCAAIREIMMQRAVQRVGMGGRRLPVQSA